MKPVYHNKLPDMRGYLPRDKYRFLYKLVESMGLKKVNWGEDMETFLDEVVDRVAEATAKAGKVEKMTMRDEGELYPTGFNEAVAQQESNVNKTSQTVDIGSQDVNTKQETLPPALEEYVHDLRVLLSHSASEMVDEDFWADSLKQLLLNDIQRQKIHQNALISTERQRVLNEVREVIKDRLRLPVDDVGELEDDLLSALKEMEDKTL